MRTPRIFILILFLIACLFLLCRSITAAAAGRPAPVASTSATTLPKMRVPSLFAFNSGFSLFSPNAAISLTDDNSTSFPAQPAAFGPNLPHTGLSGQLWIGSSFTDDALRDGTGDGELGCGDTPAWEEMRYVQSSLRLPVHRSREVNRKRSFSADVHPYDSSTQDDIQQRSGDQETPVERRHQSGVAGSVYGSTQPGKISDIPGKIVLLSRGGCGFLDKVMWAQRRGATALIVGDNQKGGPLIQMFAKGDTSNVTIPSVFTARTSAHLLSSLTQPGSFIMETYDEKGRRSLTVQQSESSGAEDEPIDIASIVDQQAREQEDAVHGSNSGASDSHPATWWQKLFGRRASALDFPDDHHLNGFNRVPNIKRYVDSSTNPYTPVAEDHHRHEGLWVTITPSNNGSPFFDTLLVLVVSPLITLTIVYAMLIVRARIRRRRWRAPKSVVEQLPVRTYHTVAASPLHTPRAPSPASPSASTPLLQPPIFDADLPTRSLPLSINGVGTDDTDILSARSSAAQTLRPPTRPEHEKAPGSVSSEWKKYMGRQIECVVCLEEYIDGVSQVMSLPCGHEFHAECM